jgi:hypothetical protein
MRDSFPVSLSALVNLSSVVTLKGAAVSVSISTLCVAKMESVGMVVPVFVNLHRIRRDRMRSVSSE